ncbi:defensin-like [Dermacentor silvarum]|uniref:defensin-like n=1 Tax=Dermacentor silvarum TaxID=543639 RepID=UPI00189ACC73|nr:defensin-like [Dermacentor silvarum]
MKIFSVVVLLTVLTAILASASAAEEGSEKAHHRVRRGFGCPLSAWICNWHCQNIGRKGGYCGNRFRRTCYCFWK